MKKFCFVLPILVLFVLPANASFLSNALSKPSAFINRSVTPHGEVAKGVKRLFTIPYSVLNPGGEVSRVMRSWNGHSAGELIGAWGPPNQVYSIENGGHILCYTGEKVLYSRRPSITTEVGYATNGYDEYLYASAKYDPGMTIGYTTYRMFYIDKNKTIYGFAWKGL